jgi:hypothetical protein
MVDKSYEANSHSVGRWGSVAVTHRYRGQPVIFDSWRRCGWHSVVYESGTAIIIVILVVICTTVSRFGRLFRWAGSGSPRGGTGHRGDHRGCRRSITAAAAAAVITPTTAAAAAAASAVVRRAMAIVRVVVAGSRIGVVRWWGNGSSLPIVRWLNGQRCKYLSHLYTAGVGAESSSPPPD